METDAADHDQKDRVDGPVVAEAPADSGPPSSEGSVDDVDQVLDQVELALTRLDEGTYGLCDACGAAIDDAHLAEQPTARTCPACASAVNS